MTIIFIFTIGILLNSVFVVVVQPQLKISLAFSRIKIGET